MRLVILALFVAMTFPGYASPADRRPPLPRKQLLHKLAECFKAIPHDRETMFDSPCVKLSLTSLNGIPRKQLIAALGPPTYCNGDGVSDGRDCQPEFSPGWSFYNLGAIVTGGGPELVCESSDGRSCTRVRWVITL
jgi:hypothetical protein